MRRRKVKGIETVAKFKDKKVPLGDADHKLAKNLVQDCLSSSHKKCSGHPKTRFSTATITPHGAVDEWFKSHAWKACVG